MEQHLYFLAIVPPPHIRDEVRLIKKELCENYGIKHALKSPAHITLQMPFRRSAGEETILIGALRHFAENMRPVPIVLDGFGSFPPGVIYIALKRHSRLIALRQELQKTLSGPCGFSDTEMKHKFHPHMTVATRDIPEAFYNELWEIFGKRTFQASFVARGITLLKHNGKYWEIFREFGPTQM
ncbi:2'-5' RNA ligase family protein [Sinomicrobium oceani]|uniref:2'-5' RNA ligase family protein n=1 Tax=Sinomicrobium oceani TaxID=1150368 RepID=UPI00227CC74F|nr:2'-5' RNA ligase family protein [Sinomicrobium oceani]